MNFFTSQERIIPISGFGNKTCEKIFPHIRINKSGISTMYGQNYERKISVLDWGIVISAILLSLTVYLPQSIWEEEVKFRKESRHRMTAIANAEEFYFEMTGIYTTDGEHLLT